MAVEVRLDTPGAVQMLSLMNRRLVDFPGELNKAMVTVLNKTAIVTRKEAFSILNERYHIKDGMEKRALKIQRASSRRMYFNLWGGTRPMTLGWWRAGRGSLDEGDRQSGLRNNAAVVQILRGRGAKVVQGAFWVRVKKTGKPLIFRRVRKGGLFGFLFTKLNALYGPNPIAYLDRSDATALLEDAAVEEFEVGFNKAAEKRLKKLLPE